MWDPNEPEDFLNGIMIELTWSSKHPKFKYPEPYDGLAIPAKGKIPQKAIVWLESLTDDEIRILWYRYMIHNEPRARTEVKLFEAIELIIKS